MFTPSLKSSAGVKVSSEPIQVDASTIAIGCWKGRASLSVMVTALDCQELLERLLMRMDTEKDNSVQGNITETDEVHHMNDNSESEKPENATTSS